MFQQQGQPRFIMYPRFVDANLDKSLESLLRLDKEENLFCTVLADPEGWGRQVV